MAPPREARQRRALARPGGSASTSSSAPTPRLARSRTCGLLHAARWHERGEISRLALPRYAAWVRALALTAASHGWLRAPRLGLDGRLVATGLYLLYGRRLFYWIGAFDPAFAWYSPYHVPTLGVIEEVRRRGMADIFDFGRGVTSRTSSGGPGRPSRSSARRRGGGGRGGLA